MANFNHSIKSVFLLVVATSGILMINGGSISSVLVQKKQLASMTKTLSKINIPQVPEFPKLGARPGKNPSSATASSPPSPPINQNSQQSANYHQPSPQSHHNAQQTSVHQFQNSVPAIAFPSLPQQEVEHPIYDSSSDNSDEDDHDFSSETFHENSVEEMAHDSDDLVSMLSDNNVSQAQESSPDFPIPLHVLSILNALGTGGSLAQASKPEKDGIGQGYTSANAVGYATGNNATVSASVSNKMELQPNTVTLTESASASASSMSNGTAFSQATLSSNGYTSQFGPGGTGWKSINKNPQLSA